MIEFLRDVFFAIACVSFIGAFAVFVAGVISDSDLPEPEPPSFTCVQTLTTDDARKLSADLWDRASAGEQTRVRFGCRDGKSFFDLERVK